jgi:tRNA pseudouridine55 synthase
MMPLEGVLPVNKPAGMTSHDVVAKARRLLRERRIGHTGTLDPMATGVLPLVIGRATRLSDLLQDMPKAYEAEMWFGLATDTEDVTGNVTETVDGFRITEADVRAVLDRFRGTIVQVPPMYSALKVDGKRLYELAREGKTVERAPREVTIYELELTGFDASGERPSASIRVRCSKGTYIRTLCADIGRAVGVPAVMSKLVRTEAAGIPIDRTVSLDELERMAKEGTIAEAIVPADKALVHLPVVQLPDEAARKAANGRTVTADALPAGARPGNLVRAYGEGRFLGLFQLAKDGRHIAPYKVFAAER